MMGRNTLTVAVAVLLISATIHHAQAQFQPGEFISWSQDSWGATSSPGNAAQLLLDRFDIVYGGGAVEIGIIGVPGFSVVFTNGLDVFDYLPATGGNGPLNSDLLDPTSTASGAFAGHVMALQLDIDFNDHGDSVGSSSIPFGDLLLHDMIVDFGGFSIDMTAFNGFTVRQYVSAMNVRLGGGGGPYNYDDVAVLTDMVTRSFEGGQPGQFAQDHLRVAVPGDYNDNGTVDAADYTVWRDKPGTNFNLAGNGDDNGASAGIVDMAGYNLWKANFGAPGAGSGSTSAAVPEPNTMLLVTLAVFGLLPIRRR